MVWPDKYVKAMAADTRTRLVGPGLRGRHRQSQGLRMAQEYELLQGLLGRKPSAGGGWTLTRSYLARRRESPSTPTSSSADSSCGSAHVGVPANCVRCRGSVIARQPTPEPLARTVPVTYCQTCGWASEHLLSVLAVAVISKQRLFRLARSRRGRRCSGRGGRFRGLTPTGSMSSAAARTGLARYAARQTLGDLAEDVGREGVFGLQPSRSGRSGPRRRRTPEGPTS